MAREPSDSSSPQGASAGLLGRTIADRYRADALIGQGGMGEVYRATRLSDKVPVAIKTLRLKGDIDVEAAERRFRAEVLAGTRLRHPNIVEVYEVGREPDGLLFMAMEFLRGQDLGKVLRRTRQLSVMRSCEILRQVLSALAHAHRAGVVHRDLKPSNFLIMRNPDPTASGDLVKLLDFGIAKIVDPSNPDDPTGLLTMTRAGQILGTPAFMAPEQAQGQRVDARADLFACGVLFYTMVAGQRPFRAESAVGLLHQIVHAEAPPLTQFVSTLDPGLQRLVSTALQKNPAHRYPSAADMSEALRAVLEEDSIVGTDFLALPLAEDDDPSSLSLPSYPGEQPSPSQQPSERQSLEMGKLPSHGSVYALGRGPEPKLSDSSGSAVGGSSLGAARVGGYATGAEGSALQAQNPSTPDGSRGARNESLSRESPSRVRSRLGGHSVSMVVGLEEPKTHDWRKTLAVLVVTLLVGGAGYVAYIQSQPSIAKLEEAVRTNAHGVAENLALDGFDGFHRDYVAIEKIREAMAMRRETELATIPEAHFNEKHRLQTARWTGSFQLAGHRKRFNFTFEINEVASGSFRGILDWTDQGVQVKVAGYHHGNHILFRATNVVGHMPDAEFGVLTEEKCSLYIFGGRLLGVARSGTARMVALRLE